MPTQWRYVGGCPFAAECSRQLTQRKKKNVGFSGRTPEEAQEKCAHHLMLSSLHLKSKRVAWETARAQEINVFEQDTDDDEPDDMKVEECEDPRMPKRPRLAIGGGDEDAAASDPLVAELSSQVSMLVGKNLAAASSAAASLAPRPNSAVPWRSLRPITDSISDAEQAARKAQDIAMKAAQAFGEVAAKLNRDSHNLVGRD